MKRNSLVILWMVVVVVLMGAGWAKVASFQPLTVQYVAGEGAKGVDVFNTAYIDIHKNNQLPLSVMSGSDKLSYLQVDATAYIGMNTSYEDDVLTQFPMMSRPNFRKYNQSRYGTGDVNLFIGFDNYNQNSKKWTFRYMLVNKVDKTYQEQMYTKNAASDSYASPLSATEDADNFYVLMDVVKMYEESHSITQLTINKVSGEVTDQREMPLNYDAEGEYYWQALNSVDSSYHILTEYESYRGTSTKAFSHSINQLRLIDPVSLNVIKVDMADFRCSDIETLNISNADDNFISSFTKDDTLYVLLKEHAGNRISLYACDWESKELTSVWTRDLEAHANVVAEESNLFIATNISDSEARVERIDLMTNKVTDTKNFRVKSGYGYSVNGINFIRYY